jgi:hypothetical protein
MAYSYVQFSADGSTNIFNFSFGYLSQDHISVSIDGVDETFTWVSENSIQTDTAAASLNGTTVEVRRTTPRTEAEVDYQDGSTLSEAALDTQTLQLLYITQEAFDSLDSAIALTSAGVFDAESRRIINVADGVDDQDAATKAQVDAVTAAVASSASAAAASATSAAAAQTGAETAETNAETAVTNAETAETGAVAAQTAAETARDKAQDWAEEDEDVEVETGQYSAKHHALKAEATAASLGLPTITGSDADKPMVVNGTADGWTLGSYGISSYARNAAKQEWNVQRQNRESIAYAASVTPSLAASVGSKKVIGDLTGSITINLPTDCEVDDIFTIELKQDATGSRAITLDAGYIGQPSTFVTAASKRMWIECEVIEVTGTTATKVRITGTQIEE